MNLLRKIAKRFRRALLELCHGDEPAYEPATAIAQRQAVLAMQQLVKSGGTLPPVNEMGFKVFSQTDEDGILLYIFSIIGTTDKIAVEICAGDGIECNTANLIVYHGWHGLLIDGAPELVVRGKRFYTNNPATRIYPPKLLCAWVAKDTINDLIKTNGFSGKIDLLCLDLDGVDYWIWKEIEVISPRVVLVEYQDILGPDRSVTVPYSDLFKASNYPITDGMPNYCGASLRAFVKLANAKGYRLVGCNRYGYNAFFVKNELGSHLKTLDVSACFSHPKVQWGMRHRFKTVENHPWMEV